MARNVLAWLGNCRKKEDDQDRSVSLHRGGSMLSFWSLLDPYERQPGLVEETPV